jgi:hypothetical protein
MLVLFPFVPPLSPFHVLMCVCVCGSPEARRFVTTERSEWRPGRRRKEARATEKERAEAEMLQSGSNPVHARKEERKG